MGWPRQRDHHLSLPSPFSQRAGAAPSAPLTDIHRGVVGLDVFIQVGDAERVERRGPHAVQELAQHEDEPVGREAGGSRGAGQALVAPTDAQLGRRARLVRPRGEVGQGKEQRAQAHDQHSPAQPAGLVAIAPEVADEGEADTGGNVVGAGDQPALVTAQVEAALDGGDDRVDEAVHRHALQEGGHAEEEQDPFGCVAELQAAGGEAPPAAGQFLPLSRHVFNPFFQGRLLLGRGGSAEGLGTGVRGAGSP